MEIQPSTPFVQVPHQPPARGLEIHTNWSTPWDGSPPDAERHKLFAAYAIEVAMQQRPLLMPFLAEVGAVITAMPHGFGYRFADSTCWINAPEIAAHLVLLPWAEAYETRH